MKLHPVFYLLFFIISCNSISKEIPAESNTIIQKMQLLDSNEKCLFFYSEYKPEVAGNLITDKRVASYWIDERDSSKNQIHSAFYADITHIDTISYAGATYAPYLYVYAKDNNEFKVCCEGSETEIQQFFSAAISQWKSHQKK